MKNPQEIRRRARADYVFKRMPASMIAISLQVSEATIGRWKKTAKEAGDDWDIARSANTIAGEGLEAVVGTVIEDFMVMSQALLEEIKHGELSIADKVKHLTSLADAMNKMTISAGKLAPKISELGVAQDVMRKLVAFVRSEFPQHAAVILEIIEPFGDSLAEAYG